MKYEKVKTARFIERPNRFVAKVSLMGKEMFVHVKNTGRCCELLIPGATVFLEDLSQNEKRKYKYSLIGVLKGTGKRQRLINMDSSAPNKVIYEALKDEKIKLSGLDRLLIIKPEAKVLDSRLDFYVKDINGTEGYIEVKGVTLENDGVVSFPDAPTERGIRHLGELEKLLNMGYKAFVIFVVQMDGADYFTPNEERHPEFKNALLSAKEKGVEVLSFDCLVSEDEIKIKDSVKIKI